MQNIKRNLNFLHLHKEKVGDERRLETLKGILEGGTFFPKTLTYEDIDKAFKDWIEKLEIIDENGNKYPTMSLFSNQRFSEYSQSWKYLDKNNNLLLNFKTITRNNNPESGKIQSGLWNIPGDRFYTMKKKRVLDDNGSESLLILKMRQPVAVDFIYKVSIFSTRFTDLNDFNTLMNKAFAARQAYICPNGHYIPMTLESINDSSQYNIDDRQFYAQTFEIKAMGYIITKDDYRSEELPLKAEVNIPIMDIIKPDVEIDEPEGESIKDYQKAVLTIDFPVNCNKSKFTIDIDFVVEKIEIFNIKTDKFSISSNDENLGNAAPMILAKDSEVKISIQRKISNSKSVMILTGYNPNSISETPVSDKIFSEN